MATIKRHLHLKAYMAHIIKLVIYYANAQRDISIKTILKRGLYGIAGIAPRIIGSKRLRDNISIRIEKTKQFFVRGAHNSYVLTFQWFIKKQGISFGLHRGLCLACFAGPRAGHFIHINAPRADLDEVGLGGIGAGVVATNEQSS